MKKNTTISFLILLSILVVSSNIVAEETNTEVKIGAGFGEQERPERREDRKDRREEREGMRREMKAEVASSTAEVRKMREENRSEIKKIRADFQAEVRTNKASSTELVKEKRQALISGIQEKRDLFKKEVELKKEAIASTTSAIKAKFKADLLKIKDEKKKVKVESAGDNLLELNAKLTARATENVNKIEEVLIAIESRADKATAAGATRLANVRALIAATEEKIAIARTAISVQSAKTYTVSIQSDVTAQASLKATRDALKADIDAMNAKVKAAHETARQAADMLKAEPKANATSTETIIN